MFRNIKRKLQERLNKEKVIPIQQETAVDQDPFVPGTPVTAEDIRNHPVEEDPSKTDLEQRYPLLKNLLGDVELQPLMPHQVMGDREALRIMQGGTFAATTPTIAESYADNLVGLADSVKESRSASASLIQPGDGQPKLDEYRARQQLVQEAIDEAADETYALRNDDGDNAKRVTKTPRLLTNSQKRKMSARRIKKEARKHRQFLETLFPTTKH